MVKIIISDVKRDELEEALAKEETKYIVLYPGTVKDAKRANADEIPGTIILDENANDTESKCTNLHMVVARTIGDANVNCAAFRAAIAAVTAYAQSEQINVIVLSAALMATMNPITEEEIGAILREMMINTESKVIISTKMIDEDYDVFDTVRADSKKELPIEIKDGKKKGKKNKDKKKKHKK